MFLKEFFRTDYLVCSLVFVLLSFAVSYFDFPPIPAVEIQSRLRPMTLGIPLAFWMVRILATGSSIFIILHHVIQFTATDVRFALIITAFAYLLTLLVEDQLPTSYLTALRSIRQNLAFSRVSPEEARDQTDVLLVGGGLAQAFQRPVEEILTLADRVRSSFSQVESSLPHYNKLISEISQSSGQRTVEAAKRAECDRLSKFMVQFYNEGDGLQNKLLKRLKKFEQHMGFVAYFSPSSAQEAQPIIEKLKAAIHPLAEQQQRIKSTSFGSGTDFSSKL